jgi:hypothetical protein
MPQGVSGCAARREVLRLRKSIRGELISCAQDDSSGVLNSRCGERLVQFAREDSRLEWATTGIGARRQQITYCAIIIGTYLVPRTHGCTHRRDRHQAQKLL